MFKSLIPYLIVLLGTVGITIIVRKIVKAIITEEGYQSKKWIKRIMSFVPMILAIVVCMFMTLPEAFAGLFVGNVWVGKIMFGAIIGWMSIGAWETLGKNGSDILWSMIWKRVDKEIEK